MTSRLRRFLLRLYNVFWQGRPESELAREVASHLTLLEDDFQRRGLTAEKARRAARRAFGGVEQTKELHRHARSFMWLDDMLRDLQYAVRTIRRDPGFTAVTVLTLALGIGANTAIFSVVNAVLLRPLPYQDSDRLVEIFENLPAAESSSGTLRRQPAIDGSTLTAFRSQAQTLSQVAAYVGVSMMLTGRDEAVRLDGTQASASTFPMLGAQPLLGRTFEPREEAAGADAVVILSYSAWQQHFSGDSRIVGRLVTLDGKGRVVVGVMPPGFAFPDAQTQFWIPYVSPPGGRVKVPVIARLKNGVSSREAAAEVLTILRQGDGRVQGSNPPRFDLLGLQDELVAPVRAALVVLATAVVFVLLIACVNVANLLLARTIARQREIAVRLALGAGRSRLVRQVLTESLVLALIGGAIGVGVAFGGIQLLRTLGTNIARRDLAPGLSIPRLDEIGINGLVLAFAVTISMLTGVLFGLIPAIWQSQSDQIHALRKSVGSALSGLDLFRHRTQSVLVIVEIAMAMILFIGGGLLIRSFLKLSNVNPGYDSKHVLTFQVSLPREHSAVAQVRPFCDELVARLQSLSSVRSAGYANNLPLIQQGFVRTLSAAPIVQGKLPLPPSPELHTVSRDFLKTLGLRVIEGHGFDVGDREGQSPEVLVNRTLARSGFLGSDPIGKPIYYSRDAFWQVAGIVEDVGQRGLDQKIGPQVYVVSTTFFISPPPGFGGPYFAVRTDTDPTAMASSIRNIIRQLDPQATMDHVATMDALVSNSISRPRLYAVLLGIFAGVAVALAAIGLYGMMAYSVTQRTREIGIRMALGAQRGQVMGLVLRQSIVVTVIGVLFGLAGAAAATRFLEGLLFGLTPLDPATFVAVALAFASVALIASWVPARRATAVDPSVALRWD